ncbi:MAG: diaminopimelate epimerase [Planctomycetes bacterium]|nr:diaminopimelate epimerase [Planctomycetota bacterium]
MKFTKMHGAGNDYVYVNLFDERVDDPPALARFVSDRHFGVGADGLILIGPSDKAAFRMTMFNADGSLGEMCGNGLRCVAKYVYDHGLTREREIDVETGAGVLHASIRAANGKARAVRLDMGAPRTDRAEIPMTGPPGPAINEPIEAGGRAWLATCLSMGNPHCVVFVEETADFPVAEVGSLIENHARFPRRVNVEFARVISRREFAQRTWERGSGETLACGTGASAVCVAGVLTGRLDRRAVGHLTGGDLEMEWDAKTNHVFLTGPAVEVFTGELAAPVPA